MAQFDQRQHRMTDDQLPDDDPPALIDAAAIRKQAKFRTYFCIGTGLALVGKP